MNHTSIPALLYFKNTKNLFIHIARIPIGDSPRVHPSIFKMSPPFASSEGYSASGVRYQSDGECVTHLLPHSGYSRSSERTCDLTLALSHSPFAYFAYISLYSYFIFTPIVILLLCDHRVRVFQQCLVDAERYKHTLDFCCPVLPTLKWPPPTSPRSLPR